MKPIIRHLLFWSPRILTICYAIFLSIFALDVFSMHFGLWRTLMALLIHLIPTAAIIVILMLSWRWEWIGGLVFINAGIVYIIMTPSHPTWWLPIAGPLFLISVLFFVGWFYRKEIKAKPTDQEIHYT